MFLPILLGLGVTILKKLTSAQTSQPSVGSMPSLASTSILLGEEKVRRAAAKKKGRASTNITGGLVGNPTLGRPALWGV